MTQRRITPKGFLKKLTTCKMAEGFLSQHREYLLTGELFSLTSPIVARVDNGDLLPVPAIEELSQVVFAHVMAVDLAAAQASLDRSQNEGNTSRGTSKPVVAIIYDAQGNELESQGFDLGQRALGWVDRHLIEQSPDCIGKVIHTKVLIKGLPMEETVSREDAYFRTFPRKKTPFMKRTPQSVSSLKGKMKVSQTRSSFSHG
jgi:hypothetical protein